MMQEICNLCPRGCGIDRSEKRGFCQTAERIRIARADLHFYEEPVISGTRGSGAIFFCGCSLRCCFCQNFSVSRNTVGSEISEKRLSELFRELEDKGAHNINLVNPTHYIPQILNALERYRPKLPIVYNSHGYERAENIERLRGAVDIYLPDLKYHDSFLSSRYSQAPDYFEYASEAILEMAAQVRKRFDDDGMLQSGLIVRHLVLPMAVYDSLFLLDWIKANLPTDSMVSLMAQYTPFGEASKFPELNRKITAREYRRVSSHMLALGLDGYLQERDSAKDAYIPIWDFQE